MHTSLLGLPRGAQPRLHVLEAKVATDWQVEFDSSHQVQEPGEGPARLGQPVTLRDQYAVPVTFMPQRDAHGQLNVYERVVIDVVFDDPGSTMGWPAKDDRFEPVYRSLLINERNALLERFQFVDVDFTELSDASLEAGSRCLSLEAAEPEKLVDDSGWLPGWLPPGYSAGESMVRALSAGEPPVMTQVYSDGLARFTVFVEPLGEERLADNLVAQLERSELV